jgi:hypothetical protein
MWCCRDGPWTIPTSKGAENLDPVGQEVAIISMYRTAVNTEKVGTPPPAAIYHVLSAEQLPRRLALRTKRYDSSTALDVGGLTKFLSEIWEFHNIWMFGTVEYRHEQKSKATWQTRNSGLKVDF